MTEPGDRRVRLTPRGAAAAVAFAAVLPFVHTLGHGFAYDDGVEVVDNASIRTLDGIPRLFTQTAWSGAGHAVPAYRPVTTLTYALNHAVGGLHPLGYHLVNLLLHAGASVLLLVVLTRVALPLAAATMAALLFAVHPAHVEAVANVAARISRRGPAVFSDFWNPPVQVIPRLVSPEQRHVFFASRARSLWDACCSSFQTLPPRSTEFIISLLVEYELGPEVSLSQEDARFLFLDCKQRFTSALAAQRRARPGLSEARLAAQAWAHAARSMRLEYGLPEDRLQALVREGTPRWNAVQQQPGAHLSFAHPPAVHWVATPPPRPKFTRRLARHPLDPGA